MPITKEIKIVKVPLPQKEKITNNKKNFPKMERLYLELLENKSKIKQDLINKEYVPKDKSETKVEAENNENTEKKDNLDNLKSIDSEKSSKSIDENSTKNSPSPSPSDSPSVSPSPSPSSSSSSSSSSPSSSISSDSSKSKDVSDDESSKDSDDEISQRLKKMLGDDDSSESKKNKKNKYEEVQKSIKLKNTPYEKFKEEKEKYYQEKQKAPTLAELKEKGQYVSDPVLRDINNVTMNETEDEDKKRELIFKFDMLKKSYPTATLVIPEYTIHSDYIVMKKSYDQTVKKLSLDASVDSYKRYLTGGFGMVEFLFGNFLGFDMEGFTKQQLLSMHTYEILLVEIGEKSYVPTGSKYPVEVRLLIAIIMNAGFFILGKMIMKKTGSNLMNTFNNPSVSEQTNQPKKRKMKGPNINIDDIPEVSENKV